MDYLSAILTVAVVHLLAVISPGPDFVMITRNSLVYSRRTGIFSAIGIGLGVLVHVFYSLVGIGVLITQSIVLFNTIKFLGAAYLIYIGYKSLTSRPSNFHLKTSKHKPDISETKAIRIGFITNVTNPNVTLFFLSLFTLVINPNTPLSIKIFMGAEIAIVTFLWFTFVAYIISHPAVKNIVGKVQHLAERFIGVVLIGLGIIVAFSQTK